MLLLAGHCLAAHPHLDIRAMEDGRFGKFLEIPETAREVAALVECSTGDNGRVRAKLLSHVQFKAMARLKEHGEVCFSHDSTDDEPEEDIDPNPEISRATKIPVEMLYRDMVPFGPSYRTLQGTLYILDNQAWGELRAPELPFTGPAQEVLGSPFPLDGALHAACVLGQQHVDYIPFPVGFRRRRINRPTQPGTRYRTRVTMTSPPGDELVFNLVLFDDTGQLYETITGVRMRDVGMVANKGNRP